MKSIDICIYNLKVIFRNIKSNLIVFVLPIAFMGIFSFAFGQKNSEITYSILVQNNDSNIYQQYVDGLNNIKTPDGKNSFKIKKIDNESDYIQDLERGNYTLILKYLNDCTTKMCDTTDIQNISIKGDVSNPYFNAASLILNNYTNSFYSNPNTSTLKVESLAKNDIGSESGFELLAPGLIIYGIIIFIPQIAYNLANMNEKQYVFRFFTSKVRARNIIIGSVISQTIMGIIQTIILIFCALAFGFTTKGNLLYAFIIAIPTVFFCVGVGLLIGSFVKKGLAAQNLGVLISIILGFLSGSFLQLPDLNIINNFYGNTLKLTDIIPTSHATEALKSILLYGRSFESVLPDFLILLVSSVIVLIIGIGVYNLKQLRNTI